MTAMPCPGSLPAEQSTPDRIVDAALAVLAQHGIGGVSMRAVAAQAGVAVGLANYHFKNKNDLIAATLHRIGTRDLELVAPSSVDPAEALRTSLRRAVDPEFLTSRYLNLRLQLWSLAGIDPAFAEINQTAQRHYLDGLRWLLAAARPDLGSDEVAKRAADILILQNGVWLTAVLVFDQTAVDRALARAESIAFD